MWSSPHGSPLTAALDVFIIGAMSKQQSSIGEWEIPELRQGSVTPPTTPPKAGDMDTSDNDKAEVSRQRRAEGASSAEIREARRRLAEREQQPKHVAA